MADEFAGGPQSFLVGRQSRQELSELGCELSEQKSRGYASLKESFRATRDVGLLKNIWSLLKNADSSDNTRNNRSSLSETFTMDISRVSDSDKYSRIFYVTPTISVYQNCVDSLRPILNSDEWSNAVTGFTLFIRPPKARETDGKYKARLTILTAEDAGFATAYELATAVNFDSSPAQELTSGPLIDRGLRSQMTMDNPLTETEFRWLICAATQVALDLMSADLENARSLAKIGYRESRMTEIEKRFVESTENQSPFYRSLSDSQKTFLLDRLLAYRQTYHHFQGPIVG